MDRIIFIIIRNFTYLGNIFPQAIFCLALCFIDFEKGFYVTGLWGWSYFLNSLIKNLVHRARPDRDKHRVHVSGFSFPSGHAMTSFGVYWPTVAYFQPEPLVAGVLYAMPFLLGLTRIYFRVHYWTDIIGGWVICFFYLKFCEGFLNHMHSYFYDELYAVFASIKGFIWH